MIRSGEGVWLERRRRPALPRRDGRALVLQRRLRPARDRGGGRRAARAARRRTRRSGPTRRSRPSSSPIGWPRWRPIRDAVVFLGSGGSDAVDTAAKLVRRYWDVVGKPEKRVIVSREHGYHGMHAWGTSLAGIAGEEGRLRRRHHRRGRRRSARATSRRSARCSSERGAEIAAFIGEPVDRRRRRLSRPSRRYWAEVQRLCREHDVLLIADEVITGFGRTGALWGSQRYGIEPDLITFAKGVTSGYLPLGGVLVGQRVAGAVLGRGRRRAPMFRHGYTYSGHAARVLPRRWPTSTSSRGRGWSTRVADPGARAGRARSAGSPRRAARRRDPDGRADGGRRDHAGPAGGRPGHAGAEGDRRGPEPRRRHARPPRPRPPHLARRS